MKPISTLPALTASVSFAGGGGDDDIARHAERLAQGSSEIEADAVRLTRRVLGDKQGRHRRRVGNSDPEPAGRRELIEDALPDRRGAAGAQRHATARSHHVHELLPRPLAIGLIDLAWNPEW
jgi:hypothetical protein